MEDAGILRRESGRQAVAVAHTKEFSFRSQSFYFLWVVLEEREQRAVTTDQPLCLMQNTQWYLMSRKIAVGKDDGREIIHV